MLFNILKSQAGNILLEIDCLSSCFPSHQSCPLGFLKEETTMARGGRKPRSPEGHLPRVCAAWPGAVVLAHSDLAHSLKGRNQDVREGVGKALV